MCVQQSAIVYQSKMLEHTCLVKYVNKSSGYTNKRMLHAGKRLHVNTRRTYFVDLHIQVECPEWNGEIPSPWITPRVFRPFECVLVHR